MQDRYSCGDDENGPEDHYINHTNTETTLAELYEMLEQEGLSKPESQEQQEEQQRLSDSESFNLTPLQQLIKDANVGVWMDGEVIKIYGGNDVEVIAKDEADLLAKLKVFKAYSEMINGGE